MFGILQGNLSGESVPFEFGNALEFVGTNDYVSIGSNLTIANNRSLNFWFKTDAFGDLIFHDSNFGVPYIQLTNSTTIRVVTGSSSNNRAFTVPAISTGNWYMCTIRFLTTGTRLYINAVESSSGAQTQTLSGNISTIGANYGGSGFEYNGVLDEISWYEADLTPTQITNQYKGGNGNYADVDVTPLLWYKLNETSGDSTAVNSGSGGSTYNGTLNNFNTATCWVAH